MPLKKTFSRGSTILFLYLNWRLEVVGGSESSAKGLFVGARALAKLSRLAAFFSAGNQRLEMEGSENSAAEKLCISTKVEQQTNTTTNLAALHFEPLISGRKECCETTEFCQSPCTNKQSLSRAFAPTNNLEQSTGFAWVAAQSGTSLDIRFDSIGEGENSTRDLPIDNVHVTRSEILLEVLTETIIRIHSAVDVLAIQESWQGVKLSKVNIDSYFDKRDKLLLEDTQWISIRTSHKTFIVSKIYLRPKQNVSHIKSQHRALLSNTGTNHYIIYRELITTLFQCDTSTFRLVGKAETSHEGNG
eukprot:g56580.t1